MSSSLTQEQRGNIRKNLPLKIFERRIEAQDCLENIEYFGRILSEVMRIDTSYGKHPRVVLSGEDIHGNPLEASCIFYPESFKGVRDCFSRPLEKVIKKNKRLYDEIPNAKIITVDFKNKKIAPGKRPEPLFKPRHNQLPDGATAIYQGAGNICEALDMGFNPSDIPNLVKEKGLPAFKANGKKHWYALAPDLGLWKQKEQRRINRES